MTDITHGAGAVIAYVALLFLVAVWAERTPRGTLLASGPVVYSLSLAVYCSTWTFYGSVGFAATRGLLFLAIYVGPTLVVLLGWQLLRKLVRIKTEHRVTSLADLISLRYGRSQAIAMMATGILVVGIVPYIALQLKTMIVTAALVAGRDVAHAYPAIGGRVGPPIVLMMVAFTVAFGIRRRSPTERHPGMMVALAVECVVKLGALTAAGAFVTWGLFHGFGDLFRRAADAWPPILPPLLGLQDGFATWLSYLLLAAGAILLLPRQFHVAVVECSEERHLRTAMWLFPGFLLAINVFVLPLALGGLLLGHPGSLADTFVLSLPLAAGKRSLSWLVFIGGFSAGTGMVMVETMTAATMISNHLLLPAAELWRPLERLRRHLLPLRWFSAAAVIGLAFLYERAFGSRYALVSIGLVSFAAVLQLAPALVGGLYWRGASTVGAAAGMIAGFATWSYTLALPVLVRAGWLSEGLLAEGPLGIRPLRPEALMNVGGLDPLSHAVFWSLLLNAFAFAFGSVFFPSPAEEAERAGRLVDALAPRATRALPEEGAPQEPIAVATEKRAGVIRVLSEYQGPEEADRLADACLTKVGADDGTGLGPLQLGQLAAEVETALASSIGAAAAHAAMKRSSLFTSAETRAVSRAYGEALANMKVSPAELHRKLDYHRERERLLEEENAELEQRVIARTTELQAANELKDELLVREKAAAANLEEAREREIEIGFKIQQMLLLDKPPSDVQGLSVAALTIPSQWIDGDFYEFFKHENQCLDLIVGDVMGKGIPAALLGAAAKSHFLEALCHLLALTPRGKLPEPKDIVTLAHADMVGHLIALESFVTLCYARLDLNRRNLDLVDCGHTALIHLQARTGTCALRQGDNLPLGIREGEIYDQISVPFEPGDVFFFYSDGITEAPSSAGELFGVDRLVESVRVNRELEPGPLVEAIREAVFHFSGSDRLTDDLTCVAIKVGERLPPLARAEIEIGTRLTELGRARDFVRAFCRTLPGPPLDEDSVAELVLAVNEAASNIMKHAYHGRVDQRIHLDAEAFPGHVSIVLRHLGDPFDPASVPPPPVSATSLDGSRESGFGIHLITRCVDEVRYYRDERGRSCVSLRRFRRS